MKNIVKKITALGAMGVFMFFVSCDSKRELAKDVEGTWASNPEKIALQDALDASVISTLDFSLSSDMNDPINGPFTMTSMFSVTTQAPASDSVVQPYSVTVTGIASANGTWTANDDDEMLIALNPSSFNITVDPKDVVLQDNILTGENNSYVDSVKPILAEKVKAMIAPELQQRFYNITNIDDIHIKGDIMKCEINDRDYMYSRQ